MCEHDMPVNIDKYEDLIYCGIFVQGAYFAEFELNIVSRIYYGGLCYIK